jgi:hypothetical protein
MTDFRAILQTLVHADVKFIVVGGVAAAAHGTARLTQDVDRLGCGGPSRRDCRGGSFEALFPHSIEISVYGVRCLCLDLPALIRSKRAAGRPKDLEALAELEALLEEQQGPG